MRKYILLYLTLAYSITLLAQENIYIHKSDKTSTKVKISTIDSIYFSSDGSKAYFRINSQLTECAVAVLDSISFIDYSNSISITYNGTNASVDNPLASNGVSVTIKGADVIINSTSENTGITYSLKGSANEGSFKIYSTSKFNLKLNGVILTNTDGPAINIQSKKKCNISVEAGTTNSLTDGYTYASTTEDQKSALFSEGQIDFDGTGSLIVKSNSAHAICSDDYINIQNGNITISGATKDGIHANDYFTMSGGTVNIASSGDGIECESGYILISGGNISSVNNSSDARGLVCDSTLTISGGTINLNLGGTQSKGIKASRKMMFSGGDITVNSSGGVTLITSGSGFDPAYSVGIKADTDIEVSGSKMTIVSSGVGGKGISATGNISITSGTVNVTTSGAGATYKNASGTIDSYSAVCLNSDANVSIVGGDVTNTSSGGGGKNIKANGTITIGNATSSPNLSLTTTGTKFIVSGSDYNHPKTMVSDGTITIKNGIIKIASSDDAIHSETSVIFDGGTTTISNSYEAVESIFIYMNGGILDLTASNDGINTTKGTTSGGTESNDGSCLYVTGGTLIANCTNGDAIDSNGNIEISGGTVIANGPITGVEEAVDFNGTFTMKGGVFIGAGSNSNMTKAMSTSSTQANMFISSSALISSSTLLHIQNASGTDIVTFKPKNGAYKFLFSSPSLVKGGSCSVYTGGSYTGGNSNNGLYAGGTYSSTGATLKKNGYLVNIKYGKYNFILNQQCQEIDFKLYNSLLMNRIKDKIKHFNKVLLPDLDRISFDEPN